MRNKAELTEAGKQYTEAYAMHYSTKDLHKSIDLYRAKGLEPSTFGSTVQYWSHKCLWLNELKRIFERHLRITSG